jgi:hypothetical protein
MTWTDPQDCGHAEEYFTVQHLHFSSHYAYKPMALLVISQYFSTYIKFAYPCIECADKEKCVTDCLCLLYTCLLRL